MFWVRGAIAGDRTEEGIGLLADRCRSRNTDSIGGATGRWAFALDERPLRPILLSLKLSEICPTGDTFSRRIDNPAHFC